MKNFIILSNDLYKDLIKNYFESFGYKFYQYFNNCPKMILMEKNDKIGDIKFRFLI